MAKDFKALKGALLSRMEKRMKSTASPAPKMEMDSDQDAGKPRGSPLLAAAERRLRSRSSR